MKTPATGAIRAAISCGITVAIFGVFWILARTMQHFGANGLVVLVVCVAIAGVMGVGLQMLVARLKRRWTDTC